MKFGAFLSYARFDDGDHNKNIISTLRRLISTEVQSQTGEEFPIFQDRESIHWGEAWDKRINQALNSTTFLIPVITPSFLRSEPCREELQRFAARERQLGRDDLILPLYLIKYPTLANHANPTADELLELIRHRQWFDWRELRHEPLDTPLARREVARLAAHLCDAIFRVGSTLESSAYLGVQAVKPPREPVPSHSSELFGNFVHIQPASFEQGSRDKQARQREQPPHRVILSKGFLINRYPVTVREFRKFTEFTGYRSTNERAAPSSLHSWRNPGFEQVDDSPVVFVSWFDALEFCMWASKYTQRAFRLATEAEWEYCCKAGMNAKWCCGEEVLDLKDYAWYRENSGGRARPVGQKSPNTFGLFDMHGNVWEWCSDWYGKYEPFEKGEPVGPGLGRYRVAKGGSWCDDAWNLRSSFRIRLKPVQATSTLGFRLVEEK